MKGGEAETFFSRMSRYFGWELEFPAQSVYSMPDLSTGVPCNIVFD